MDDNYVDEFSDLQMYEDFVDWRNLFNSDRTDVEDFRAHYNAGAAIDLVEQERYEEEQTK